MNLLDLVARERTRRAENPDDLTGLPNITDDDRVKALSVLIARAKSGNLLPIDEQRITALNALIAWRKSANLIPGPKAGDQFIEAAA